MKPVTLLALLLAMLLVPVLPAGPAAAQSSMQTASMQTASMQTASMQTGAPAAAPTGAARLACWANLTRLKVSIPAWEEAEPWPIQLLGLGTSATQADLADRAYCAALLDEVVVSFGAAGAE
ncbi:hypothetical protein [Arenibaculum sp.]|jgi:hypothetical protein|uniref:hypothetical protein n=1 Tax=Arenibaculum sp. TaxID=2865862 RepID=UPI002E11D943|nr:hypothetical protein [Arenibaculum sp.]